MDIQEILKLIEQNDKIIIFSHVLPDGDAYGSQIGLKNLILDNFKNKKVYVCGTGYPKMFPVLGEMDNLSDDDFNENVLGILVDLSHTDRVEDRRVTNLSKFCKIDHHIAENEFNYPSVVDVDKSSNCEILANLAFELGWKVSEKSAKALLLGIITDSQRGLYSCNYKETFDVCSKLVDCGANPEEIFNLIYEDEIGTMKYKGYILSNFVIENNVAYIIVDKHVYQDFNISFMNASNKVNVISGIKGIKIWLLFTESDDGYYRVELRSKGISVQQIAVKYGGGGHEFAAGCKIKTEEYFKIRNLIDDCIEVSREAK